MDKLSCFFGQFAAAQVGQIKFSKANTGNRKRKMEKSVKMLQNGDNDSISIKALLKLCAIEGEITMII